MHNPLDIPQSNDRAKSWYSSRKTKWIGFIVMAVLCILETLAVYGGYPSPPLAAFYGIAAVYIIRS